MSESRTNSSGGVRSLHFFDTEVHMARDAEGRGAARERVVSVGGMTH